jgi:hypothetical protein
MEVFVVEWSLNVTQPRPFFHIKKIPLRPHRQ